MKKREIEIRLIDTTIAIGQEPIDDPTWRGFSYTAVIRLMRRDGWTITEDPEIKSRFPTLNDNNRIGTKGDLRASIENCGRTVEVKIWATTWALDNQCGPRYDFNKLDRMTYLDQKRFEILRRKIVALFEKKAVTKISDKTHGRHKTAAQFIAAKYAESWHTDKDLGRPICDYAHNATSADAYTITHGAKVWTTDRKGRIVRGRAFYNLNNMWWIALNDREVTNKPNFEIFVTQPDNLRTKRNSRIKNVSLERARRAAIKVADWGRAVTLETIRLSGGEAYRIWSRKWGAYYASDFCGYAEDRDQAGIYTRDEAESHCRAHPDILSLETPDGLHISFEAAA